MEKYLKGSEKHSSQSVLSKRMSKRMLSFSEACLFINISKKEMRRLILSRKIPFYNPEGEYVFFDRIELENWCKENKMDVFIPIHFILKLFFPEILMLLREFFF
jgi:excisionase family DNA binding protein